MIYENDTKPQDSLVGVSILGQFRIVRVLAEGGMGTIYLAEQEAMERFAAIKIVRAGRTWRPEWQARFRQEARAASRLKHPNIVTVYNFGEFADGSLFLAMEYIEGVRLSQLLSARPLPLSRALNLARQIAAALAHAHRMRVVHCDLKPDNIMVTQVNSGDLVKILDFGIARLAECTQQTHPGGLIGTPGYMSPEQCRGELATAFADQYSLGLLLYEMVAGQPAIRSDTALGYLHMHQHCQPPQLSSLTPALEPIDPIVARMLAKQPEERYPDMQHVLDELDEVMRRMEGTWSASGEVESEPERTLVDRRRMPIPVLVEGPLTLVSEEGKRALEERGYLLEVARGTFGSRPDVLRLVVLPEEGWKERWQQQVVEGSSRAHTLFCVDTRVTTPLSDAADLCGNLLIGPHPLDTLPLLTALEWMRKGEPGGIECALPGEAVQMLQVTSSMDKASYMSSILEDAQNEGLRHRVRESLAAIGEEMILNAIFHAPVDAQGVHHYAEARRDAPLVLRPGEEGTLRWLISDSYVAIGMLDGFGSLSVHDVLSRATGTGHRPLLSSNGGVGMGLNIIGQAAQHLVFAICAGTWCEVLALVPRGPMAKHATRSLCLLADIGSQARRLGSRLRMREKVLSDGVRIEIVGDIDESADLHPVFARSGTVHIDLAGVGRVNSIGIRAWIDALRTRPSDLELFMERCSPSFVNQINLIPTLTDGIEVLSFFAPYYCPQCQSESLELLHVVEIDTPPPPRCCARCRGDLVFDAMTEEYFAFVANS